MAIGLSARAAGAPASTVGAPASPAAAEACESVAIWSAGAPVGLVCRAAAADHGLTVLDLGDDWTPALLAPDHDGPAPDYRATYLALAQERFADAPDETRAASDRYLELFGIEPALGVIRARLADAQRHACHAAIAATPLLVAPARIAEEARPDAVARIAQARALRAELERERDRRRLATLRALAAADPHARAALDRIAAAERHIAAVRAAQAHLACDRLFEAPPINGAYTWQTSNAVEAFQRGAMILPTGVLDTPTIAALVRDSRERDFTTALRALRERVVAATGLIEDGSAGAGASRVLDRELEPEATWRVRGHDPLDGAAPDLVSAATAAAAEALGWRDPASTLAFLEALADRPGPALIAVPLPPPPAYHTRAMQIAVEIDRGDVYLDPVPVPRDAPRRPALILYATVADRRIPLVRWPTTIGGWQDQVIEEGIEKRWKESPAGPRVWRDLFVGPRWLPPRSTPDRELVRSRDGRYELNREELGPSYRAAFGMVAFIHLAGDGELWDEGIRTHGTGNLVSLAHGVSHGCHRLLGVQAVRLAGFVLAHREHVRRGEVPVYYRRVVRHHGSFPVAIDSLGYQIELVPPIAVDVLAGRVHGP